MLTYEVRFALLILLLGACNPKSGDTPQSVEPPVEPPVDPPARATPGDTPKSPAPAATKLGDPISGAPVALAAIAKDPGSFTNKTVVTTGTVTAVCQQMGCWMEIADTAGEAHVKMHGHSFFVPKTASGRKARVQAIVQPTDPQKECSQEAEKQTGKPIAKVQLDATGVELLD